jgi:hypothetical protein
LQNKDLALLEDSTACPSTLTRPATGVNVPFHLIDDFSKH